MQLYVVQINCPPIFVGICESRYCRPDVQLTWTESCVHQQLASLQLRLPNPTSGHQCRRKMPPKRISFDPLFNVAIPMAAFPTASTINWRNSIPLTCSQASSMFHAGICSYPCMTFTYGIASSGRRVIKLRYSPCYLGYAFSKVDTSQFSTCPTSGRSQSCRHGKGEEEQSMHRHRSSPPFSCVGIN